MIDVEAAYRHCERVTRLRAGNFYYGIRLLPPAKRRAMCAVYAFAREVDDIGDGELAAPAKLAELEKLERRIERLGTPGEDAMGIALADATRRFALPVDALEQLLRGVRMDIDAVRYEHFDELVEYCRCVAGSIGRLCLAIFGSAADPSASRYADDLGVAMQLTNILRDIREDHENGRVYLPAEDIKRFGVSDFPAGPPEPMGQLIAFEAARARGWFDRGLQLVPLLDRRSASCVLAMTGIYRRLLERIDEGPSSVIAGRMSLPPWEKAWVAARSLVESAP